MEFKETEICPKCNEVLEKKEGMFFLKEAGLMAGLVCEKCKGLYASKEWLEALSNRLDRIVKQEF